VHPHVSSKEYVQACAVCVCGGVTLTPGYRT
jgi:hypothetical protein